MIARRLVLLSVVWLAGAPSSYAQYDLGDSGSSSTFLVRQGQTVLFAQSVASNTNEPLANELSDALRRGTVELTADRDFISTLTTSIELDPPSLTRFDASAFTTVFLEVTSESSETVDVLLRPSLSGELGGSVYDSDAANAYLVFFFQIQGPTVPYFYDEWTARFYPARDPLLRLALSGGFGVTEDPSSLSVAVTAQDETQTARLDWVPAPVVVGRISLEAGVPSLVRVDAGLTLALSREQFGSAGVPLFADFATSPASFTIRFDDPALQVRRVPEAAPASLGAAAILAVALLRMGGRARARPGRRLR